MLGFRFDFIVRLVIFGFGQRKRIIDFVRDFLLGNGLVVVEFVNGLVGERALGRGHAKAGCADIRQALKGFAVGLSFFGGVLGRKPRSAFVAELRS